MLRWYVLVVVLGMTLPPPVTAEIFRCVASNGLPLYQNFPCDFESLDALPAVTAHKNAKDPHLTYSFRAIREPTKLTPGMTTDEVRTLLGEPIEIVPDQKAGPDRFELWRYDDKLIRFDVHLHRVASIDRL